VPLESKSNGASETTLAIDLPSMVQGLLPPDRQSRMQNSLPSYTTCADKARWFLRRLRCGHVYFTPLPAMRKAQTIDAGQLGARKLRDWLEL